MKEQLIAIAVLLCVSGPVGAFELNGELKELTGEMMQQSKDMPSPVPAKAADQGERIPAGSCSIHDNLADWSIAVSFGNGRFAAFPEPLGALQDSSLSYAASSFRNPVLQAIGEVKAALETGRCREVKKADCDVRYLDMAPGTTRLARNRYSLNIRYKDENTETLPTYAKNMRQLKAAIGMLTETGLCENKRVDELPVCRVERYSPGYNLQFNGRIVEEFFLEGSALNAMREARGLGLCR